MVLRFFSGLQTRLTPGYKMFHVTENPAAVTDLPVDRVGEEDLVLLGRVNLLGGRATGLRQGASLLIFHSFQI